MSVLIGIKKTQGGICS